MIDKLGRFFLILLANTVLIYALSILGFLLISSLTGANITDSGFLIVAPLSILVFVMFVPAILFGIVNSIVINAFWKKLSVLDRQSIPLFLFAALAPAFIAALLLQGRELADNAEFSHALIRLLVAMLLASVVIGLSNLGTIVLTRALFPGRPDN